MGIFRWLNWGKRTYFFLFAVLATSLFIGMDRYLVPLTGQKNNIKWSRKTQRQVTVNARDNTTDNTVSKESNLTIIFEERRKVLLELCKTNGLMWRGDGSVKRLIISKRYQLSYCPVPKIASTFLSNLILENSPSDDPTRHHDRLDNSSVNKWTLHLKNLDIDLSYWYAKHYKSMLFVRDPYSRLLAAYIDKFFTPNPLYWAVGRDIIKKYRNNADQVSLRCGQNVEFAEFIKHVMADVKLGRADQHWKPIYQRCSPCQLEYDVIGKLENMKTEGDYIIKKYLPKAAFSDIENETALMRIKMNVDNFYRFFPTSVRFCMRFPEALSRLLKKLQIRGMINKDIDLPREWKVLFSIPLEDVKKFMVDAYSRSTNKTALLSNRHDALVEAFRTVPMKHLHKIKELYIPDFKLFGYDSQPDYLFNRSKNIKKFFFD